MDGACKINHCKINVRDFARQLSSAQTQLKDPICACSRSWPLYTNWCEELIATILGSISKAIDMKLQYKYKIEVARRRYARSWVTPVVAVTVVALDVTTVGMSLNCLANRITLGAIQTPPSSSRPTDPFTGAGIACDHGQDEP